MKYIDQQEQAQRKINKASEKLLVELLVNLNKESEPTDWWEDGSEAKKPGFLKRQAE